MPSGGAWQKRVLVRGASMKWFLECFVVLKSLCLSLFMSSCTYGVYYSTLRVLRYIFARFVFKRLEHSADPTYVGPV